MKKKLVIIEIKEFLNNIWKYKNNKLYKLDKRTKKFTCLNDNKPKQDGYIQVFISIGLNEKKNYYLNRLVYFFHNQNWNIHDSSKSNEIDHRNQNKLDNSIENLKVVNGSQNKQNSTNYGKKPIKGVYFCKNNKKKLWMAKWYENNKQKCKYFYTEQEALEHRKKMVEVLYYQG